MKYKITFEVVKERIIEAESEEQAVEAVEYDWEGADVEGGFEILTLEVLDKEEVSP